MKLGDLVQRNSGGGGHGLVVGFVEGPDGQDVVVRWSETAIFPNPTRERATGLVVVRSAGEFDAR